MKIIILGILFLCSLIGYSQNHLKNSSNYYGFNALPSSSFIKISKEFKLNNANHPLDSVQGSLANNFKETPTITIKQKDIGRIVFYAKNKFINDSLFNGSTINGNINIKFLTRINKDSVQIKLQEDINLKSNWIEYHKYLKQPNINEIQITFNSEVLGTKLLFDKLKITELTDNGIAFYENQIKNEQILLSTVNQSNYNEQSNAIKDTYKDKFIPTLFIYRKNINNIISFDDGRSLGQEKAEILNPFEYDFFEEYFKELRNKADYAQKLELDNIENDIDNNNWLEVAGNVLNVVTGGTFNTLINSIKNILNEQIVTFDGDKIQLRKISGRFYGVHKKGSIKTLNSIVKKEKDREKVIEDFNEALKTNNDYIHFLSRIQKLRVLEVQSKEKFELNSIKIKELKAKIDLILVNILKESNANSNINDFYGTMNTLSESFYITYFTTNYNSSVTDINSFVDKKIQFSILQGEYSKLIEEIEKTMSETKTLYDNSFTTNSLNTNLFSDLTTDKDISDEWKKRAQKLENTYLKSSLMTRIKNITKIE